MDVAAMSVAMSQNQVRSDASVALMDKMMNTMEQQGAQLTDMLQQSVSDAPHPSIGNQIDLQV
ncbi:Putative motility protein [Oceanobacillus limi]|uniref:Putative motility protein n=1 Tax=Oceanobacillus limi TaxID=930131 RepID=A0A1I0A0R1_9BACI|nr:YjfB family protein [Oceanobacillus limi]SES87528.1 Putative motility protein [Oceanobacillus limi]